MDGNPIPGIRLLIVDDMDQVRQDLSTVLPLAGNAAGLLIQIVGEAVNGREAIRQAAALQPDVVLMDLAMPVIDGYAATQAIKDLDPTIRVVALTVLDYSTAGEKARLAGVDGFIEKGAPVAEIIQTIHETLKEKR